MKNKPNKGVLWAALALCLALSSRGYAATDNGLGQRPYMGWSSWSLEATKYPGYGGQNWVTAAHIMAQSDLLHKTLQAHGYTYVNMDSGWMGGYDAFGRPAPDKTKFPQGIEEVARHVHANGQKLGIYWIPGINGDLYNANPPIKGTPYHIRDIVFQPTQVATGWGFGNKIDYSKPGAQAYINSVADQFAAWGMDFLKLDGVTPGSDRNDLTIDARPDVAAWAAALKQAKRPIWLELSWNLDRTYSPTWQKYANGRRITDDVESYGSALTSWGSIPRAFDAARDWAGEAGAGKGWNDLDSLDIGCGEMDGLTKDERQTVMTLWAISCSPLYTGDDLSKLDADGIAMLTNDEVIAVDQAGHPASPLAASEGQVWVGPSGNGGKVVALFNRDGRKSVGLTVSRSDLGLTGPMSVRDLWDHKDLGLFPAHFTVTLAPHASQLLRLVPGKRG